MNTVSKTTVGYTRQLGNILDQWTPIIGGDAYDTAKPMGVPRWVPVGDRRRVKSYEFLDKLMACVDRPSDDQSDMTPVRFGTTAYMIDILRDLTIGGEQRIQVKGATDDSAPPGVMEQQNTLDDWARRNKVYSKIQSHERSTALLGDSFIRLRFGRTSGKKDVKFDVIHPAFVFPQYDADDEMTRCDLIWEEYIEVNGIQTLSLYRDTYELAGETVLQTSGWFTYSGTADLKDLKLDKYAETSDGKKIDHLDLVLPRIPVYHLPNFYLPSNFGESDLTYSVDVVAQGNAAETDIGQAAGLLGIPMMVVAGLKQQLRQGELGKDSVIKVAPGGVITVDPNGGKAEFMDNTKLLTCLVEHSERVEQKLFRNMRLGKLFSGQTDNIRDIESAKAFKTLLASLYARVAQKRTVRKDFYPAVLTGVMTMLAKLQPTFKVAESDVTLDFGNVLPLDNAEDLRVVADLWAQGKGPLSAATATKMLQKAGAPVVDLQKEAAEIQQRAEPPKPTVGFKVGGGSKPTNSQ